MFWILRIEVWPETAQYNILTTPPIPTPERVPFSAGEVGTLEDDPWTSLMVLMAIYQSNYAQDTTSELMKIPRNKKMLLSELVKMGICGSQVINRVWDQGRLMCLQTQPVKYIYIYFYMYFYFYIYFYYIYIYLLIMLLQLFHLLPLFPPPCTHPLTHIPPLSSCPWVVHISSLASPFPTLFLTSPYLFCDYHLCFLFPVPFPHYPPFPFPTNNPSWDLHFCNFVPVLVICFVHFCSCWELWVYCHVTVHIFDLLFCR